MCLCGRIIPLVVFTFQGTMGLPVLRGLFPRKFEPTDKHGKFVKEMYTTNLVRFEK